MLPRFFIPSTSSSPGPAVVDAPAVIEDVLATVTLGTTEIVVGADIGGSLRAIDGAQRRKLAQRAQGQLAFHEVAASRPLALTGGELYLFNLQMVELLPDAPGLNDPLYLYGALRGPYPGALDTATAAIDGQLTVSRGDLLAALIDGVERAFVYPRGGLGSRCVHALVAGEPADAIAAGRGLVLAVPVALMDGPANDLLAAQIFYDVLRALRADLGVAGALPVPSRRALEESMIARGWKISGDTATRKVASILRRDERMPLPPEARLEDYVAEATGLLARLGAPTPTSAAVRARAAPRFATRAPVPRPPTPAPPPTTTPPPPIATPRPRIATPRTEWIQDFVDAHRKPDRAPPVLVTPGTPAWMEDFAEPAPLDTPEPNKHPPDWSDDFE